MFKNFDISEKFLKSYELELKLITVKYHEFWGNLLFFKHFFDIFGKCLKIYERKYYSNIMNFRYFTFFQYPKYYFLDIPEQVLVVTSTT